MKNLFNKKTVGDPSSAVNMSESKNPLEAVFKSPVSRQLIKSYRKEIDEFLEKGEQDIIERIQSLKLAEGETQIIPLIDIDQDPAGKKEIHLVITAFSGQKMNRVIFDTPLRIFIKEWLQKQLK